MKNTNVNLKKILRTTAARFALMWIALLSSGYAIASQGTVIDKATGKPIAGAVVATSWSGYVPIAVQTLFVCYDLEVTTTDERGRFTISTFGKFRPFLQNKNRSIDVIASGYETDRSSKDLDYVMVPRQGTKSEQFEKANRYQRNAGCPDDKKKMLPFMKAVYKDLASLALTKKELDTADSLLWQIETIELGQKIANENSDKRELERIKQDNNLKNIQEQINTAPVLSPEAPRQQLEPAHFVPNPADT